MEKMQLGLDAEQLARRRSYIGGTDAKRIMDGDWPRLWAEKTGRAEPEDLSNILAVQLGSFTEPFNRFWFEKQTGRKVTRVGEFVTFGKNPPLACNLDGETTTAAGERCVWDAKHVGNAGEAAVIRYTPQMTHNATVIGVDWWCLSFLIGNSKWEMIEQEVDPFYANDLLAKEIRFWGYVERDEEPPDMSPVAAPKPTRKLRTISLEDVDSEAWPNWGYEMVELFSKFANTHAAAAVNAISKEEIRGLMPEDVGTITRGLVRAARDKAGIVRVSLGKEKR